MSGVGRVTSPKGGKKIERSQSQSYTEILEAGRTGKSNSSGLVRDGVRVGRGVSQEGIVLQRQVKVEDINTSFKP